ncbi:hypothetical protein L3Y19_gp125 [Gordonia phage Neville]|uniref:Uncharacterized protein n=2 Tax=Nevillevirus TaxID=3044773 RepID=A0A515MH60_9CAUD|nr:hypothetical protein L3Y19_gp125 [Gordonia phage Neville]YP_010246085.1 hypothetical protein L3Y20_gp125 [Gordonia phage Trax]AXQ64462.1 hypothetical protein SEA_NEVILLE_105 [Gordonia phage Neville]QDM55987.1 hypothetical protein SEA_TRAX_107 [Gordonia phage Trax]
MGVVIAQTFFPSSVGAGITATLNMWRFTNSMASYYQIAEVDDDLEDLEWTRLKMLNKLLEHNAGGAAKPSDFTFSHRYGYFVNGVFTATDDPESHYIQVEAAISE